MPYYYYPFGVDGDLTTVPLPTQGSGSISYQQGWGPDYELNLLTNPDAIPIGRTSTNQLFNDITTDLQLYYQTGVPPFISTSDNQGTPFPYPIYARVRYLNVVYENQVAGNVVLPGTDASWLVISGDSTGVLPATVIDYAGIVVPAGYLWCDGSAYSRTTYATLLAAISQTQTGTTTNTLATVSGLTSTAQMYIGMPLESAHFPSGTTVLTIVDANNITVSANATASGAIAIHFFNWGNGDGSTTFNVPDFRRRTSIGTGGSPSSTPFGVPYTAIGSNGGEEAHTQLVAELAAHTHTVDNFVTDGASGGSEEVQTGSQQSGSTGSSTPFNVMQPTNVLNKIIKY